MTTQTQVSNTEMDRATSNLHRSSNEISVSDRTDQKSSGGSTLSRSASQRPDSEQYEKGPNIENSSLDSEPEYKLYKRRWIGLALLTLLNFAVGWGYAAPGVVSLTAIFWFKISFQTLNWLNVSASLAFLVPAPFTIYILNKYGPKFSIQVACVLCVIGNWIIYAAAREHNFSVHILGTVVFSLSAPFVLAAPSRYSRTWFDERTRTLATALPSLAYPVGAGTGALSGGHMVKPLGPYTYDTQALIVAIIFTVLALPSPFIPRAPPTAPCAVAAGDKLGIRESFKLLLRQPAFYLQFVCFTVYAGATSTITAITVQSIIPYHFPQVDGGYAIACLAFVGLAVSLVVSPILDRTKGHLLASKIIVVIISAGYTALPFIPRTHNFGALCAVYAIIGAAGLSIEPCVLEFQAIWTHPVGPEFSSVLCWTGAKVFGAIFTIIAGDELVVKKPGKSEPMGSTFYGLIFIAAMCWFAVPFAWLTGVWKFRRPETSRVKGNAEDA